jgi:hypothetical protein
MALLRRRLHYAVFHSSYYTILRIHILRTMSLKRPFQEDSCDQYRSVRLFQKQETTLSFFNGSEDIPAPSVAASPSASSPKLEPPAAAPPSIFNSQLQPQRPPPATAPPSIPNPRLQPQCLSATGTPSGKKTKASLACDQCRRAKTKCDEGDPCYRCKTSGYKCVYTGQKYVSFKELSI